MPKKQPRKQYVKPVELRNVHYKIVVIDTQKEIGCMLLKDYNTSEYDLYPDFEIPHNYKFPQTARNSREGWAEFNKFYELYLKSKK